MGELAKTLVGLSGPDSVHGVIPRSYISLERPEDAVAEGNEDKGQERGWIGKVRRGLGMKEEVTKEEKAKAESTLLSEEKYGKITVVADVQIRKKVMCNLVSTGGPGSGFIALSGGFGTMDEVMEMVTWGQLGVHRCGVCLFNVEGFWDTIVGPEGWMERAIESGFVREEGRKGLVARDTAEECVEWLKEYKR